MNFSLFILLIWLSTFSNKAYSADVPSHCIAPNPLPLPYASLYTNQLEQAELQHIYQLLKTYHNTVHLSMFYCDPNISPPSTLLTDMAIETTLDQDCQNKVNLIELFDSPLASKPKQSYLLGNVPLGVCLPTSEEQQRFSHYLLQGISYTSDFQLVIVSQTLTAPLFDMLQTLDTAIEAKKMSTLLITSSKGKFARPVLNRFDQLLFINRQADFANEIYIRKNNQLIFSRKLTAVTDHQKLTNEILALTTKNTTF